MNADVDVAAPGSTLRPVGRGATGLWQQALDNLRTGNLGILPDRGRTAPHRPVLQLQDARFFTADNFNNVIVQMAGLVILRTASSSSSCSGIDLSIGYLSGLAAVFVAELQLRALTDFPFGYIAPVPGLSRSPSRLPPSASRAGQGIIVAKVGVPSFVVTLMSLLMLRDLSSRSSSPGEPHHHRGQLDQRHGLLLLLRAQADRGDHRRDSSAVLATSWVIDVRKHDPTAVDHPREGRGSCWPALRHRCHLQPRRRAQGLLWRAFSSSSSSSCSPTWRNGLRSVAMSTQSAATPSRRAGISVARIRISPRVRDLEAMAEDRRHHLAANVNSVDLNVGGALLLNAISAAVIGGVSLFGGRGEVGVLSSARSSHRDRRQAVPIRRATRTGPSIYVVTGAILLFAVTLGKVPGGFRSRPGVRAVNVPRSGLLDRRPTVMI